MKVRAVAKLKAPLEVRALQEIFKSTNYGVGGLIFFCTCPALGTLSLNRLKQLSTLAQRLSH